MSEPMKPEANQEELTNEQLEEVSGGDKAQVKPAPKPQTYLVIELQNTLISG